MFKTIIPRKHYNFIILFIVWIIGNDGDNYCCKNDDVDNDDSNFNKITGFYWLFLFHLLITMHSRPEPLDSNANNNQFNQIN